MFCRKCGREIDHRAEFCPYCGNGTGQKRRRKRRAGWGVLFGLALVCAVIFGAAFAWGLGTGKIFDQSKGIEQNKESRKNSQKEKKEAFQKAQLEEGFESPQAAMEFFIETARNMDFAKMLKAFPIRRASEYYDFEYDMSQYLAWSLVSNNMLVPSTSEYNIRLNEMVYEGAVRKEIANWAFSFFADDKLLEGKSLRASEALPLVERCSLAGIKTLEIENMQLADSDFQNSEEVQNNFARTARIYGADMFEEYSIEYRIGNRLYSGGLRFIVYGDRYYLWQLNSVLLGTQANAYVEKEFDDTSFLMNENPEGLKKSGVYKESSPFENGFDSPEMAMEAFVSALRDLDYYRALEVFSAESIAESFDLKRWMDRTTIWDPANEIRVPGDSEANRKFNAFTYENAQLPEIYRFVFSFAAKGEILEEGGRILTGDQALALLREYDLSIIKDLELAGLQLVNPELQYDSKVQQSFSIQASNYGADTYEEYEVFYKVGERRYKGEARFLVNQGRYYLAGLYSVLGTNNAFGFAERAD